MCLHYRYSNLDEEIQERQIIKVGKPLVSKLNLQEPRLPRSCSASASFNLQSFSLPESSSSAEGFGPGLPPSETSSMGSASTTWSYYSQSARESATLTSPTSTRRVNVPEETDSPESFDSDAPLPLITSKGLPHSQAEDITYKFSKMYNFHSH